MAMLGFDQIVPGMADTLQYAVPQQSGTGSELARLLAGGFMPEQAPPPEAAPEAVMQQTSTPEAPQAKEGGGGSWAARNPKIAGMLLHGLLGLAQGGNIGQALNRAAMAGMLQEDANRRQQIEDEKLGREKTESEARIEDSKTRRGLDTRRTDYEGERVGLDRERLGLEGKRVALAEKTGEATAAHTGAQTDATRQATEQAASLFGKKQEQLALAIQQAEINLTGARTENERKKVQLQIDRLKQKAGALELERDQKYGDTERKLGVADKTATVASKEAQVTSQTIGNQVAGQKADALGTLTPEEIATGVTKPKSRTERLQQFYKTAAENSPTGKVDIKKVYQDFETLEQLEAGKGASEQPTPGTAASSRRGWETARNAVKVGQQYTGPDGKTYVRKN